jgi:hypothetical protein
MVVMDSSAPFFGLLNVRSAVQTDGNLVCKLRERAFVRRNLVCKLRKREVVCEHLRSPDAVGLLCSHSGQLPFEHE